MLFPQRLARSVVAAAISVIPTGLHSQVILRYDTAPLTSVVQGFAGLTRTPIVLAPEVGDPRITLLVSQPSWRGALDEILASISLAAHPDVNGGLRVEERRPLTVRWINAPLENVLLGLTAVSQRSIVLGAVSPDLVVTEHLWNVDWAVALDAILDDLGLVASVDAAGVIRIENRPAPRAPRSAD